ncbi:hypothetical protein TNCV_1999911 [Trichonephila clavipes]|nr:hypothetical protein TNCV_1999911 [Trichonephila clavipes]
MGECTYTISEMSIKVHAACRRVTKFIFEVTTSPYTKSLIMLYRKKRLNGVRSGDRGGHRSGVPCLIYRPEYVMSNQSRTEMRRSPIIHSSS